MIHTYPIKKHKNPIVMSHTHTGLVIFKSNALEEIRSTDRSDQKRKDSGSLVVFVVDFAMVVTFKIFRFHLKLFLWDMMWGRR